MTGRRLAGPGVRAGFTGLPTGLKMLLVLSAFLLPLALVALLASLENVRENSARRASEAQARIEIKAQRLNAALMRSEITVRAAGAALAQFPAAAPQCAATLRQLDGNVGTARYALYAADGRFSCASAGYVPPAAAPQAAGRRSAVRIARDSSSLEFFVFGEDGRLLGAGDYPRATLADTTYIPGSSVNFDLALIDGARRIVLHDRFSGGALVDTVRTSAAAAAGTLRLDLTVGASPITATQFLSMVMPLLICLFAGAISWLILDRFLLRPLVRMQRAVLAYRPGDAGLNMPRSTTPAREIEELGTAFDRVTRVVARHEADLEAAVERQKLLVREVHHRVKNNLQVVASLLNLHARGATSEDAAAAYASIQRRVDALAVVHRNHYAELEEYRGVALRPLISELSSSLRGSAPAEGAQMPIRLAVAAFHVTQDVAVSVAFLITEIVEYAMLCEAKAVTIILAPGAPGTATLAIEAAALRGGGACSDVLTERFTRIVTGLARQLRSTLETDEATGRFAVDVAVVDEQHADQPAVSPPSRR